MDCGWCSVLRAEAAMHHDRIPLLYKLSFSLPQKSSNLTIVNIWLNVEPPPWHSFLERYFFPPSPPLQNSKLEHTTKTTNIDQASTNRALTMAEKQASKPLRICCYGSSSSRTPAKYTNAAYDLGKILAKRGHVCVNGAGT